MNTLPIIHQTLGLASAGLIFAGASSPLNAQERPQEQDPFVKKKGAQTAAAPTDANQEGALIRNVLVQVEYIEVEKDKLSQYTQDPGFGTDATHLRKEVQSWIADGEASVYETSLITTRSGKRAKVESIRECIYPTEWSHANTSSPTAFETRNEGTTVEVDPVLNAVGNVIALSIAPEIVTNAGETPALPSPAWLQDGDVHIPHFVTLKTNTSVICAAESHTLLGTMPSIESDSTSILVFARCGISQLQAPPVEQPVATQINFAVEWIDVPTAELSDWLFEEDLATVSTGAYGAAQSWLEEGKAAVLEIKTLQTKSGQRCKIESLSEVMYPSEYGSSEERGVYPAGFETRNQGTVVELDPFLTPDGNHVDLAIAPEMIRLVGTSVLHRSRQKSSANYEPDVTMPIFYTMRPSTAVTIALDQPTLLVIMTPADANGNPDRLRKVLFFVTARR